MTKREWPFCANDSLLATAMEIAARKTGHWIEGGYSTLLPDRYNRTLSVPMWVEALYCAIFYSRLLSSDLPGEKFDEKVEWFSEFIALGPDDPKTQATISLWALTEGECERDD